MAPPTDTFRDAVELPAVAKAAVVPAPDELRLAVPKAYVTLAPGHEPSRELAADILAHTVQALLSGFVAR